MEHRKLIALEGIDGSGKSTQAVLLKLFLDSHYLPSVIIKAKEKHQDEVFHEFVDTFELKADSPGYMFLYQALHRRQFELARAALDKGLVVIADRWNPSFFVYHHLFGTLSTKPKRLIKELDRLAFEGLEPGLCILIDVPVKVAFDRRVRRTEAKHFSDEESRFYETISEEYRKMATGGNWRRVDGDMSVDDVHHQIVDWIMPLLKTSGSIKGAG